MLVGMFPVFPSDSESMWRRIAGCFSNSFDELGRRKPKVALTLFAAVFTIAGWPLIALYLWAAHLVFPYPLFVGMISGLIVCGPTSYWIISRRNCVCLQKYDEEERLLNKYYEEKAKLVSSPRGEVGSTSKTPELEVEDDEEGDDIKINWRTRCWRWTRRVLHWGFFCGLFGFFFILPQSYNNAKCQTEGNVCVLFFRSDILLMVLIGLGALKSKRRGKRLDWLVALFMACGISLATWNKKEKFVLDFAGDSVMLGLCFLASFSYGLFVLSLRRSTLHSGVFKTLMIMAFYVFLLCIIGTFSVERTAPWVAIGHDLSLIWKVFFLSIFVIPWIWAIVATAMYSETIVTALSLQMGLFLGDFGIQKYVLAGLTWTPLMGSAIPMLALSALWLIKRMVTLHFPNTLAFCKGKLGCIEEDIFDDGSNEEEEAPLVGSDGDQVTLDPALFEPKTAVGLSGNTMGNFDPDIDYSGALSAIVGVKDASKGQHHRREGSTTSARDHSLPSGPSRKALSYGTIGAANSLGSFDPDAPSIETEPEADEHPLKSARRKSLPKSVASVPYLPKTTASQSSLPKITPREPSKSNTSSTQVVLPKLNLPKKDALSPRYASEERISPNLDKTIGLAGNPMGNYEPGLDYSSSLHSEDAEEDSSEASKGDGKKKNRLSKLFKLKK